ncbi:unnamed protein product [Cochlearia groenlandica]
MRKIRTNFQVYRLPDSYRQADMTLYRIFSIGVLALSGFSSLYRFQQTDKTCRYNSSIWLSIGLVARIGPSRPIQPHRCAGKKSSLLVYRSPQTDTTCRYRSSVAIFLMYRSQQADMTDRYGSPGFF